jgi:DNA-binding MarR family transcriptional regulator
MSSTARRHAAADPSSLDNVGFIENSGADPVEDLLVGEVDRAVAATQLAAFLTLELAQAPWATRPLTVKEIGERLVREHGSPSRLMGTLVKKGLVERLPAEGDGRLTVLRLTARGRTAAHRMTEAKRQIDAAIAPILEQHDVDAALALLRSLVGDLPAGRALARRITDDETTTVNHVHPRDA